MRIDGEVVSEGKVTESDGPEGFHSRSESNIPVVNANFDRKIVARRIAPVGSTSVENLRKLRAEMSKKGRKNPPGVGKNKNKAGNKMEGNSSKLFGNEGKVTHDAVDVGSQLDTQTIDLSDSDGVMKTQQTRRNTTDVVGDFDFVMETQQTQRNMKNVISDIEIVNNTGKDDWNQSNDNIVIADISVSNDCDIINPPGTEEEFNQNDNSVKRNEGELHDEIQNKKSEDSTKFYIDSDNGPFVIHLTEREKEGSDRQTVHDIHDVVIGHKLKKKKVKGIIEVKKVTRRELKVIFSNRESANDFLKGRAHVEIGLNAYIPKYNVTKVGIIFDIPTGYGDRQLMEELESDLPITGVYRCQKRSIKNGVKGNDWIPANTVKVTFRGQSVPDEVIFGYSKRKVKPDVPKVTQCFKCARFGHIAKYCRQTESTCHHCGTQHRERPCPKNMKCFHCHSNNHDGFSKECPEFLRNELIKEAMYYKNLTFKEADDLYPRTESQYRLAEKEQEFPDLPVRRRPEREERVELSFPKKSTQDLKKQYDDYIQLNQGIKPAATSSQPYSEIVKKNLDQGNINQRSNARGDGVQRKTPESQAGPNAQRDEGAFELVKALRYNLERAYTDHDQEAGAYVSNDVLLIQIGQMLMEFFQASERKVVSYAKENLAFEGSN